MEHHDKRSFESHVAKHREYAKWEANRYRQLMAHPERWEALSPRQKMKYRNLTKWWLAPAYFAVCYIRKLGFLDGYAGLRFALFKAWYFSLIRKQLRMDWDAFIQADMEQESRMMHEPTRRA